MRSRKLLDAAAFVTVVACLPPLALPAQEVIELPGRDQPITIDAVDVFSVGSLAGEEWETFGAVTGVAFDAEGNLYILDRTNFKVVKVGPEGDFLDEMGRSGGGPGEFGMPMSLAVTHSGEVRVFDMGQQGFTVFNPDGSFKTSARLAINGMFLPTGGIMPLPNGDMVDGGVTGMRVRAFGGEDDPMGPRPVHFFTLGDEVEVLSAYQAWNPLVLAKNSREQTVSAGGIQVSSLPQRAFDPGLFVGVFPSGQLAVADSTTYVIKVVEPGQGVVKTLRRPFSPKPVTRRDQDDERDRQLAEIEAREAASGSGGGGRIITSDGSSGGGVAIAGGRVSDLLRARLEAMEFAEEIPVVSNMAVDWTGRIWVERTGQRVGEDGPVDLIGMDGEYLGSVDAGEFSLPDAFGPNGLAAWIEQDELDVPVIVVKRLAVRSPAP